MLEELRDSLEARREEAERKREELRTALREGRVRDPFSSSIIASILISAAISTATAALNYFITPRQRFTQGDRGGQEFQIQRSAQGTPIPEIFGADPGDNLGGGVKIAPIIAWLSRDSQGNVARKHTQSSRGGGGGKAPKAPETTTVTYDLDALLLWARGPLTLRKLWAATDVIYQNLTDDPTGVPDVDVDPDDDYDPLSPHGPYTPYTRPRVRFSGELLDDGNGGRIGTIQAGSYAGIAAYEGNGSEVPDSVVESAVDALHGEGSTPAYRRYATTRLSNFYLSRWQEVFPPMQGLLEHSTLKTLEDIFSHLCERVGLTSDDYDFSDLASIDVRGVIVSPPYTPKELMTTLARLFGVYFYESDKIYGLRYSSAPTFALSDSDLGWVDEDSGDESVLPELAGAVPVETEMPRRVTVKYIDPERNYAENSQNEPRQITTGQREEIFEVMVTMTAAEAREAAQRELYREDIEATTHSFSLSYEHIYRNPGDVATITRTEGFTHQVRITSIKPALGALECEGVAIDTASYTQPVSTESGGFETPPVRFPGQTLFGVYDGPLLRDEENSTNNGLGFYAWAVKRHGDGDFTGSALYVDRGLGYELIAQFTKQAVYGVTASTLTGSTSVHDVVADSLTIDLHNPDDIIESNTREDLLAGAGACIVGDEVCQILDAEREPDTATYPNRWYLVIGLRARRGTDFAVATHATGERFVLINDALVFVPINNNEQNVERNYKMVSSGQSLDDAATVPFTFTAGSVKPLASVNVHRRDDSIDNQLWQWSVRDRLGHGLHAGNPGFDTTGPVRFEIDIFTNSGRTTKLARSPVRLTVGDPQPAALISYDSSAPADKFSGVDANTLTVSGVGASIRARSLQEIRRTGNYVEATLSATSGGVARLGLIGAHKDWRDAATEIDFSITLVPATPDYTIRQNGVPVFSGSWDGSTPTRVRIEIVTDQVRFFFGAGTAPVYNASLPAQYPLMAFVSGAVGGGGGTAHIEEVYITTGPDPQFVYTIEQQTEDFGSAQATTYMDIYRLDDRGGRGYPARVALTDEG